MDTGDNNFRQLAPAEREILDRLLTGSFEGREEIRQQIATARVKRIDEDGSLEFQIHTDLRAPVKRRIPVEGSALDADGTPIQFLLHVVQGKVAELEVFKADCGRIIRAPNVTQIEIVSLP